MSLLWAHQVGLVKQRPRNLGAKLVIAAHREERLKALVETLPDAEISYAVANVTNKEEVQAVVDLAVNKYGRVDVLYNSI